MNDKIDYEEDVKFLSKMKIEDHNKSENLISANNWGKKIFFLSKILLKKIRVNEIE